MYEFICKRCGRRYYSASSTGPQGRCAVCGGELEPTGVKGELGEDPSLPPAACRSRATARRWPRRRALRRELRSQDHGQVGQAQSAAPTRGQYNAIWAARPQPPHSGRRPVEQIR